MVDYSTMSDADLLAMVKPKATAPAQQDYSKLSDADLMKMVKPQQPSITDAVTDIPHEVNSAYQQGIQHLTGNSVDDIPGYDPRTRGQLGPIEGLMRTGRQLIGLGETAAAPITGAVRSLIGHPLARAEHAAGTLINPELAAKDNPQQMYENAKGDVDTAMMAAKPSTSAPKILAPSTAELKTGAKAVYNDPAIKAIDIPPADVTNLASTIENSLTQRGNRPTQGNAPGTFAEVKNLYPDANVSAVKVDDLRSARRALNVTAKQIDPATFRPTSDAEAATHAIGHIDSFLDTVAPEIKTANADYSAAKGAERLDYRMAKAEHRAARTGIGGNLENVMRQEADKIPNRGLTTEEQAARDQIVMGTPTRNALRVAGKAGVDGGLSLALHLGSGIMSGGATAPITLGGTVARKLGEHLTRRAMENLSEQIRSRAPMAKALAATAQPPQIPQRAKALAAALMSQRNAPFQLPQSILPANANQNQ